MKDGKEPGRLTQAQVNAVNDVMIPLLPEMVATITATASALRDDDPYLAWVYSSVMEERIADAAEKALRLLQ